MNARLRRSWCTGTGVALGLAACISSSSPCLAAESAGTWRSLAGPSSLSFPGAAYDASQHRMVVVSTNANQVWTLSTLDDPTWADVPAQPWPLGTEGGSIVFDPLRDRLLLFGGGLNYGAANSSDTWELSLANPSGWKLVETSTGTRPAGRFQHAAIYDPTGDRMIVFGEYTGHPLQDTWALSLSGDLEWQLVSGVSPAGSRYRLAAIYDPVRDRMIVYGGYIGDDGVWALDLSGSPSWMHLASGGPGARSFPAAVYDGHQDRLLVFGGITVASYQFENDVWSLPLSGGAWTPLSIAGAMPAARGSAACAFDPVNDRLVLHGGYGPSATTFADSWSLSLATTPAWTDITDPRESPRCDGRARYAARADDPVRGQRFVCRAERRALVLFARGLGLAAHRRRGGTLGAHRARRVLRSGVRSDPGVRRLRSHVPERSLVAHPLGRRARVGIHRCGPRAGAPRVAHAGLRQSARPRAAVRRPWTRRALQRCLGATALRRSDMVATHSLGHAAVLALRPQRDLRPVPRSHDRVRWKGKHRAAGRLGARAVGHAALDPDRHRVGAPAPALRTFGDPRSTREPDGGLRRELHRRGVRARAAWPRDVDQARARRSHLSVDAARGRLRSDRRPHAGLRIPGLQSLVWNRDIPAAVPRIETRFSMDGVRPNPMRAGNATVSPTLPDAAPARLELLDVAGRVLFSQDVGMPGVGRHDVALRSPGLAPGVFWLRLTRAGRSVASKIVVTR
jgi:hypothetical protein